MKLLNMNEGGEMDQREDGYYWARLFSKSNEPQIVYFNQWSGVSVIGSRERFSDYYDVKEWLEKIPQYGEIK